MRMIRQYILLVIACMMLSSCETLLELLITKAIDPDAEVTDNDSEKALWEVEGRKEKKKKKVKEKLEEAYPSFGNK